MYSMYKMQTLEYELRNDTYMYIYIYTCIYIHIGIYVYIYAQITILSEIMKYSRDMYSTFKYILTRGE